MSKNAFSEETMPFNLLRQVFVLFYHHTVYRTHNEMSYWSATGRPYLWSIEIYDNTCTMV